MKQMIEQILSYFGNGNYTREQLEKMTYNELLHIIVNNEGA